MSLPDSMFQSGPSFREIRAEQEYLAWLQTQVRGEPGRPRVSPEPLIVREASELIDSPTTTPPVPERSKRRRKAVKPQDLEPSGNTDLARYARKLKGEP
jgi:hypothetical protein